MSKSIRAVPAILTDDPKELETLVRLTETFTDFAQLDIMDGRFVPSRSITCEDIAGLKMKLKWEAHLMILQPETYLEDFRKAGAEKIVFHYEATQKPGEVIAQIKNLGISAGLAVNPETPLSAITPLVKNVDSVLFLAVNPGFYGAQFIPEVLDKIEAFRRAQPELEIGIDGGIKEGNIARIAQAGVDVIYIGSAIFRQADPGESYRRLLALAETNAR